MKYSICGFSQKAATTFVQEKMVSGKKVTQRLDIMDLEILRWFVDFYANPKMEKTTIEGNVYGWVFYEKVLEDLPLLSIGKQALFRRLKKMVEFGILTHYTKTGKQGTQSLYGIGPKYNMLINSEEKADSMYSNTEGVGIQVQGGMYSNTEGVGIQVPNKDISINDSSINDSSINDSSTNIFSNISDDTHDKESTTSKNNKKTTSKKPSHVYYPDELLNNAFLEFIKMRVKIKKPLTDRAIELCMKKLEELSTPAYSDSMDNDTAIKILEQSIMNCWQGVFPLKEERKTEKTELDKWRDAL